MCQRVNNRVKSNSSNSSEKKTLGACGTYQSTLLKLDANFENSRLPSIKSKRKRHKLLGMIRKGKYERWEEKQRKRRTSAEG